ncbi:MAG: SnoaL-like domain-containing protein, partial [Acidimicrobiales bacterium]|nr:SnoaL-like domain-containing protein [Acidimicrobiales bacterium]
LQYRIIADCAAKENTIYDEWIVRDQGAIVRQLGIDPKRFAADQIEREGGPEHATIPLNPNNDPPNAYVGTGNDSPIGHDYAGMLADIMNADLATVERSYDRAVHLEHPGGITAHGRSAADQFWLGLRSAFPSATFIVHHTIGMESESMPPRAAVRWSLWGTHDGLGAFGPPSGAEVYVMGISHAEFGPWGLRREYVLLDETAIWKQILLGS